MYHVFRFAKKIIQILRNNKNKLNVFFKKILRIINGAQNKMLAPLSLRNAYYL